MKYEITEEIELILEKLSAINGDDKTSILSRLVLGEYERLNAEYNSSSIRILHPDEAIEKFEWLKIQELANKYHCTVEWVERGLEACWRAGVDKKYFVDRYLEKDKTIPANALVSDAFREILHEKSGQIK